MEVHTRVLVISTLSLFLTVLIGFIGFPSIFRFIVKDQTALRRRNVVRSYYLKLPIPMEFKVFFWTVKNPKEVLNGHAPVLEQVGPYVYDAYKEKIDIVENDIDDTLSYNPYDTYFFSNDKSGGLSDDDYVTIINPLVVGANNYVMSTSPPLMPVVDKAMKLIFNDAKTIYLKVKVKEILFEGMEINCSFKDFNVKALCSQLKGLIPQLLTDTPQKGIYRFSLLGNKNGTIPKRFKVMKGIKKSRDLGRLLEYDDQRVLNIWGSKRCNRYRGTDGWIFPPFLEKEEGIWTFTYDLCRNVHAYYFEETEFKGLPVRKYYANLGDMSANPEDKCYCPKKNNCLPKGVMDLSKCMGVPIYASLPHFAEADPALLRKVEGLSPDLDSHSVKILFESMTGTPVEAFRRMQFNLPIRANPKIGFMKNLPDALHPIFWIEESISLKGSLLAQVAFVFLVLKIVVFVKYSFLMLSVGGLVFGGYLRYKHKKQPKITPVHTASSISTRSENTKSTDSLFKEKHSENDYVTHKMSSHEKYEDKNHVMSGHEFDRY